MSDTTEWDGMPLEPEKRRSHLIVHPADEPDGAVGAYWNGKMWFLPGSGRHYLPEDMGRYRYLGPCALPSDLAAAVEAEREACAAVLRDKIEIHEDIRRQALAAGLAHQNVLSEAAQKALGSALYSIVTRSARSTGPSALAEHTARVRREAIEQCAAVCAAINKARKYTHPDLRTCEAEECEESILFLLTEADDAAG